MSGGDSKPASTAFDPAAARPAPPSHPDDRLAEDLRGFGPIGILAIVAILLVGSVWLLPTSAVLVVLWAWRSHTPWRAIGFVRPRSWLLTILLGVAFGVAFKFAMKALVMPLLGAPPENQAYHYLAGNTAALPQAVLTMFVAAGFGEETVFRGFLFERLGKLFGTGVGARVVTVALTSALFAAGHYINQGVPGVEQAAITGTVFGTIFAISGELPLLMIAHAMFDVTAVWMIYSGVESKVAHLIFR